MRPRSVFIFSAVLLVVAFLGRERFRDVTTDSATEPGHSQPPPTEVLEYVPAANADPAAAASTALSAQLRADPDNLALAIAVCRGELDRARQTGDQRHLSYAQAALAPWWTAKAPPPEVRLLRATIQQSLHRFDAALVDLDALLLAQPNDAQARLTRATVLSAAGSGEKALKDCEALQSSATMILARTCFAQVLSNQGRSGQAYDLLIKALRHEQPPENLVGWVESTLGEASARSGAVEVAELHFRKAIAVDPSDRYTRAVYVDLLLSLGRKEAAVALLQGFEGDDAFLLRSALAGVPGAADQLRARQAAARERKDTLHLREAARFTLHVEKRPDEALSLALENWKAQKEHADAVLLLESAVAAKKKDVAIPLLAQLQNAKATDPAFTQLAELLR